MRTKKMKTKLKSWIFDMKYVIIAFMLLGCVKSPSEVSPKYKVGDCYKLDFSGEFKKDVLLHKVLKVGKKEYFVMKGDASDDESDIVGLPWKSGSNISYVDRESIKINCIGRLK